MRTYDKCKKKGYVKRSHAKKTLKELKKKGRKEKAIYFCDACDCFHLTSMNKKHSRIYQKFVANRN